MLSFFSGHTFCPCCAYAFSPAALSTSRFACTAAESSPSVARAGRASSTADLRLDGATIVDPRDGSVVRDASILVSHGIIVAIDLNGSEHPDPATQRIDAKGKFVVPGYNDMHSHALELEDPSGSLAMMLTEGVTGFRQMSGSPKRLAERREGKLPIGKAAPALLETPGTILSPLNAGSAAAVAAEIESQQRQGADFIKVGFVSPPVFMAAMEAGQRLGISVLGHLQDGVDAGAASGAGFRSIEHLGPGATMWVGCSSNEADLKGEAKPVIIKAPPAGIPFVRRLIMWRFQTMLVNPSAFMPPAYVERMQRAMDTFDEQKYEALAARFVERDTWHCPTLVRLRTQEMADAPEYQDHEFLRYMPANKVKKWRAVTRNKFAKLPAAMRATYAEAYSRQLELAGKLATDGVKMMTGTDGGAYLGPGLTMREEFAELGKAGFSPLKILQMTTINAAEYLGRTDTMGTVAPGRNADLVLLDANPLDAVANLQSIAGVVRAGHYYSREDLAGLRSRVASGGGYLN